VSGSAGEIKTDTVTASCTDDDGRTLEATASATVEITGPTGCTRTQGYWKTHTKHGPAPFDEAWYLLAGPVPDGTQPTGADVPFFETGLSYYEILWTDSKGGNAYIILAHQYIAAQMNILNGASAPAEVIAAMDAALVLLSNYAGALDIPKKIDKKNNPDRDLALQLAGLLDSYNKGVIGPGHCDDTDNGGEPDPMPQEF
jgi:hypothetical protein